jgi:hypothetical protein
MRKSALVVGFLAAALSGCVTAYEPATGVPPGLPRRVMRAEAPVQPAPPQVAIATRPAAPVAAVPETPAGRQLGWVIQSLGAGEARNVEQRFSPAFLAQVPAAQIERIFHEWRRDELGPGPVELVRVEQGATPESLVAFVRAGADAARHTQVRLTVDDGGRIAGLLLAPLVGLRPGAIETWGRFDDQLAALPGRAAFGAYELVVPEAPGGELSLQPIHTLAGDEPLSIGSTFKLWVLGALAEMIAAGRTSWDTQIEIVDDLKSLPTGQMQLELEGTFYPVSRYAHLMISISDNTATDHLLHFIGRENVEAYMSRLHARPERNLPLLSTMEFFRLKLGPDRVVLTERYATADVETRRAMLASGGAVEQTTPSLAAAALWRAPFEIERIGWFASADDLARLMADLHRLEHGPEGEGARSEPLAGILRANPGLTFDPRAWRSVAYKGGSEPGVLNMTWLLERLDGRMFVMTITWNDARRPVENRRLADLAGAAAGLLAEVE